MNFVNNLVSKGVSRTGAAEVLLGLPISQASDRVVLARLALPAAHQSLSPKSGPSQASAPPRPLTRAAAGPPVMMRRAPRSLPSGQELVNSLASGHEGPWSDLVALMAKLAAGASSAEQQKVKQLKAEIEKVKRQLESTVRQLAGVIGAPPPSPAAVAAWQAMIQNLRNQVSKLEEILKALLAEVEALVG